MRMHVYMHICVCGCVHACLFVCEGLTQRLFPSLSHARFRCLVSTEGKREFTSVIWGKAKTRFTSGVQTPARGGCFSQTFQSRLKGPVGARAAAFFQAESTSGSTKSPSLTFQHFSLFRLASNSSLQTATLAPAPTPRRQKRLRDMSEKQFLHTKEVH